MRSNQICASNTGSTSTGKNSFGVSACSLSSPSLQNLASVRWRRSMILIGWDLQKEWALVIVAVMKCDTPLWLRQLRDGCKLARSILGTLYNCFSCCSRVNNASRELSKLMLICFNFPLPAHADSVAGVSVLITFYSIYFYAGQTHAAGQGVAFLSFTSINPDVLNINSKCPVVGAVIYDPVLAEDIFSCWWATLGHSSPWHGFTEPTACLWGRSLANDIPVAPTATSNKGSRRWGGWGEESSPDSDSAHCFC